MNRSGRHRRTTTTTQQDVDATRAFEVQQDLDALVFEGRAVMLAVCGDGVPIYVAAQFAEGHEHHVRCRCPECRDREGR